MKRSYVAFFIDMNPGVDIVGQALVETAASRFALTALLRQRARRRNDKDNSQAESFDEIAPIESEVVGRSVRGVRIVRPRWSRSDLVRQSFRHLLL